MCISMSLYVYTNIDISRPSSRAGGDFEALSSGGLSRVEETEGKRDGDQAPEKSEEVISFLEHDEVKHQQHVNDEEIKHFPQVGGMMTRARKRRKESGDSKELQRCHDRGLGTTVWFTGCSHI